MIRKAAHPDRIDAFLQEAGFEKSQVDELFTELNLRRKDLLYRYKVHRNMRFRTRRFHEDEQVLPRGFSDSRLLARITSCSSSQRRSRSSWPCARGLCDSCRVGSLVFAGRSLLASPEDAVTIREAFRVPIEFLPLLISVLRGHLRVPNESLRGCLRATVHSIVAQQHRREQCRECLFVDSSSRPPIETDFRRRAHCTRIISP